MCSLEGRSFQALLNGLSKKNFDVNSSVTYDFLTEQLYSGQDLEKDEILAQMKSFEKVNVYGKYSLIFYESYLFSCSELLPSNTTIHLVSNKFCRLAILANSISAYWCHSG